MKKNLIFSLFNVCASIISSLLLLPIIQRSLGIEAYGYTAVALSLINISTVVSVAITSMSSRFIAVSANQGEIGKAQQYFSTILLSCILLGLIIVFLFAVASLNINLIMNVQGEFKEQVQVLLVVLSLSLFCTLVKTPFVSGLYYSNDLYVDYCFMGLSQLARVVVPLIVFQFASLLWVPYLGSFVVDCFAIVFYLLNNKKYLPGVLLTFKHSSLQAFKEVVSSGSWVSLTKAGAILLSTINLYLANLFFTSYEVGIFASITQVQGFMSVFTAAIVNIFIPNLYRSYAKNENELKAVFKRDHIIVSFILGVSFAFVSAWSIPFLRLWTSEDVSPFVQTILTMTLYPLFTYPVEYLNQLFITKAYVKYPAIATIFFGVLNIICVFTLAICFKLGILSLALAQAISILLRNYFVYVPIGAKLLGGGLKNLYQVYRLELQAALSGMVVYLTCSLTSYFLRPDSWLELILVGFISLLVSSLVALLTVPKGIRRVFRSNLLIRKRK